MNLKDKWDARCVQVGVTTRKSGECIGHRERGTVTRANKIGCGSSQDLRKVCVVTSCAPEVQLPVLENEVAGSRIASPANLNSNIM